MAEETPISHSLLHVHVRTSDRVVEQWTSTRYATHDLHVVRDVGGAVVSITPKFDHGAAHARDGCVVEEITPQTLSAIFKAMPDHGWGVSLSADHQTVTPMEPPEWWLAQQAAEAASAEQRTEDLALLAASDDPHHQALARLHGYRG